MNTADATPRRAELDEFVRLQQRGLQRIAWLLTGEWSTAEEPGVPNVAPQTVPLRPGEKASFALGGQRALPGADFSDQVTQVFVRRSVGRCCVGPLFAPAGQLNLRGSKGVPATFHYTAWAHGIL